MSSQLRSSLVLAIASTLIASLRQETVQSFNFKLNANRPSLGKRKGRWKKQNDLHKCKPFARIKNG